MKNFNKQEYQAIRDLKHNTDIIIKPADKGSAIVSIAKADYIVQVHRQLSDSCPYEPTDTDHTGDVIQNEPLWEWHAAKG